MKHVTIEKTVTAGLCTSCGICKGVCPGACIRWERSGGMYLPMIDPEKCVNCGLCAAVCPGLGHAYEPCGDTICTVTGPVHSCVNAWSRDSRLRHVSASGGIVSTLVRNLLQAGAYDCVFCLDSYDYRNQLTTQRYDVAEYQKNWDSTPKSRYLPVSHENAVAYVKKHRDDKVIFIGTSCALRGFENVVAKLNLNRENYLLIGLFCDSIFNYNVVDYFRNHFCGTQELAALHFKNKESGGWPGNMKFFPEKAEPFYIPKEERGKAKAYFMPERCLYCVDKLNAHADISVGDNYTGENTSALGSNSVIVRTERGTAAWKAASGDIEAVPVSMEAVHRGQSLEWRLNNLYFGDLRARRSDKSMDLNRDVPREKNCADYERAWNDALKKLQTGSAYDRNPERVDTQMRRDADKKNPLLSFVERGYYYFKRKIM